MGSLLLGAHFHLFLPRQPNTKQVDHPSSPECPLHLSLAKMNKKTSLHEVGEALLNNLPGKKNINPRKLQHTPIEHTQSAIPLANYERNPFIASW